RQDEQICRFEECPANGDHRLGFKRDNRTNFFVYTAEGGVTATRRLSDVIESKTSAGIQFTRDIFEANATLGTGLPPGGTTVTSGALQFASESNNESRTFGGYVEEHLAIRDRLFLTGAIRSDRNSAFGQNFETAFYPKLAASWVVSDEPFFPAAPFINQLRLRTAYGASGVQPGNIDAVQYFLPTAATLINESGDVPGLVLFAPGNPDLKPERSTEIELGIDGTFWDNRINTELTYYDKSSKDALVSRILPPSTGSGATSRLENLGEVRNWGWEGLLNAQLVQMDAFGWDVTLNGSTNSNELVSLGGVPPITGSTIEQREGYPLNGWWQRRLVGWEDKDGDGIIEYFADSTQSEITVSGDRQFHGYSVPRHEVAFTNGIDLLSRRLRIAAMIDYKGGHKVYNNTERIRCASRLNCAGLVDPKSSHFEQARTLLVRVHPARSQAGFFEDGDFLRFRELSVSYTAPESFASRYLRGRSAVLSLAARNLGMIWTKYTGVDAEAFGTTGDSPSSFQAFGPPTYYSARLTLGF
ncbi:MAG TPA: TonB-dependent receptor, partial [Gemmatimonadaceae bacterium]|nr:TonB-dependent receptor [Gemmatimonadaceae bacterium]